MSDLNKKRGPPKGYKPNPVVVAKRAESNAKNGILSFWGKVRKGDDEECWPWTGCVDDKGYGSTRLRGKSIRSHRKAWILTSGPIPDGLHILHSCDNPPCCNPRHLRAGTHAENMDDMSKRMRARFSILTIEQVNAALDRIEAGERGSVVCDEFGVSRSALHMWMEKLNRKVGPRMSTGGYHIPLKGEENGFAKLTQSQVDAIRKDYVKGSRVAGLPALAKKYAVSHSTIWGIVSGRSWRVAA